MYICSINNISLLFIFQIGNVVGPRYSIADLALYADDTEKITPHSDIILSVNMIFNFGLANGDSV